MSHELVQPLIRVGLAYLAESGALQASAEFPKREDRAPFPPEHKIKHAPPPTKEQPAEGRRVADREFWELI